MDDQDKDLPQQESSIPEEETGKDKKQHRHVSAAELDSIIGSATDAVHNRHAGSELGNTGTNVSYEGPTAPGGGGSAGTGYGSGSDATGAETNTTNENDIIREENNPPDDAPEEDKEDDKSGEEDDTLGNP